MAVSPRKRRTSSGASRFGGGSRRPRSQNISDLAVTVKSYHVSNETNAAEEENYLVAELLSDLRHFNDVYKAGTEFKVFMRPVDPSDNSNARRTIRSLQKKTAAAHSTGDALDPGSDIYFENVEIAKREGETVLVAGYGRGLIHAKQKNIVLTDEDGNPEQGEDENGNLVPAPTLCGKTYADIPVMISPAVPYSYTNSLGEEITRKRMQVRAFFPEQASILKPDVDSFEQLTTILQDFVFNHPEEDVDWGQRGVELFAYKKADGNLPKADQVAFYSDYENAPITYSMMVFPQREESGVEGERGERLPWTEDGLAEIKDTIEYLREAESEVARSMLHALLNPAEYIVAVVPAVTFRTFESLTPGYTSQEGRVNERDFPQISTPLTGDPVYLNGKPQVFNFPDRGGRPYGVYHRCEYLPHPGIIYVNALPVVRSVQYYSDKPLNEHNEMRREPYKNLETAPFKIMNYPFPAVRGINLALGAYFDEHEQKWQALNLPRTAVIFLEDLDIAGLPEALSEAHNELRLEQKDIHYSYRVEKGYSKVQEGWPMDDGSGPDDQDYSEAGQAGAAPAQVAQAAPKQAASAPQASSSWDAGSHDVEDDEIPF